MLIIYDIEFVSYDEAKEILKDDRKRLSKYEVGPPDERYDITGSRRMSPQKCFTTSFRYVADKIDLPGIRLVHGWYKPPMYNQYSLHAWVELPNNIVYDGVLKRFYPKDIYYKYYEAINEVETRSKDLYKVGSAFGHTYGPWFLVTERP